MKLIMGTAPCGMMKILAPLLILTLMKKSTPRNLTPPLMILTAVMLLNIPTTGHIIPLKNFFFDKLSVTLIILTLWVTSLMLLSLPPSTPHSASVTIILLSILLIFAFASSNLLIFYIFFEASLVPTVIIILTWGGQPERLSAAMYFFMYTFISSLFLLLIIMMWDMASYTLYMHAPLTLSWYGPLAGKLTPLWGLLVMMPFLVKVPIYSLHLWLPKAHVEAPLVGSMILASILLKLGGYGLIRLNKLLMFWHTMELMKPAIYSLAIFGSVAASFACLNQTDMKALIAYSSVAHMGPMLTSIMTMTQLGDASAILIMVAHGLASSCLFVLANETYLNTGSRSLIMNKGVLSMMPPLALFWMLLLAMNMSTPPSLNFFGEIFSVSPLLSISPLYFSIILLNVFFTGAYTLLLYTNITHGPPSSMMNLLSPVSAKTMLVISMHLAPLLTLPFMMYFMF